MMNRERDVDVDYFDFEDSDQEGAESSEDELDILLHGTPEQKRKLCRRGSSQQDESSSEDDFEKEMNAELNGTLKAIEKRRRSAIDSPRPGTSDGVRTDEPQKYIDDVYCDSDEEEMVKEGKKKEEQKQLSNDELLYDPDIDDDNERWMEQQRRSYLPSSSSSTTAGPGEEKAKKMKKTKALPNSDAILDCPACMTTLCLDCQRHDVYQNQYRAMFVLNCDVDKAQVLKYPKPTQSSHKRKKQKGSLPQQAGEENNEDFNPVKCTECNTVVAVYDKDEIYHFFNVLASY